MYSATEAGHPENAAEILLQKQVNVNGSFGLTRQARPARPIRQVSSRTRYRSTPGYTHHHRVGDTSAQATRKACSAMGCRLRLISWLALRKQTVPRGLSLEAFAGCNCTIDRSSVGLLHFFRVCATHRSHHKHFRLQGVPMRHHAVLAIALCALLATPGHAAVSATASENRIFKRHRTPQERA